MNPEDEKPTQAPNLDAVRTGDNKPMPASSQQAKEVLALKGELEHADGERRVQIQKQIERASAKMEE